jgi:tRNA G18 (ribose-2'-O)-methylase SpoU
MRVKHLVLIAHNLRSCHNVGSLLRTAEGLGVEAVWLTGYTPYPAIAQDNRLPHESKKISKQINKTALGAEDYQTWFHRQDILPLINELKSYGYKVAALEQTKASIALQDYKKTDKLALIVGREVEGVETEVLNQCDIHLEIPMAGKKESFNVAVAAAMAMHHLKFVG